MRAERHRLAVLVMRAQGFHDGHEHLLKEVENEVDSALVLVGSSYRPRSWKNPFTFAERRGFIEAGTRDRKIPVGVMPLIDTLYNDRAWASNVRAAVRFRIREMGLPLDEVEVILTGFEKDASSAYQSWFPEWERRPVQALKRGGEILNATDLREAIFFPGDWGFGATWEKFGKSKVDTIVSWMERNPQAVEAIRAEGRHCKESRARLAAAEKHLGYPVVMNTVDAVCVMSGHVLLMRRDGLPGKGTLALPGGHVLPRATAKDSILEILRQKGRTRRAEIPSRKPHREPTHLRPPGAVGARLGAHRGLPFRVRGPRQAGEDHPDAGPDPARMGAYHGCHPRRDVRGPFRHPAELRAGAVEQLRFDPDGACNGRRTVTRDEARVKARAAVAGVAEALGPEEARRIFGAELAALPAGRGDARLPSGGQAGGSFPPGWGPGS